MSIKSHKSSQKAKDVYKPFKDFHRNPVLKIGPNISSILQEDPKLLSFISSRHKFVGKMFNDFENVLEIGCMEGFGSLIVSKFVKNLKSIDFYEEHIEAAQIFLKDSPNIDVECIDILEFSEQLKFDGCFALDVLEHIDPDQEKLFMRKVHSILKPNGVFIVGLPSIESQKYTSIANRDAHINCQESGALTGKLKNYFYNVFSFGMNDEVIHTGYDKMCNYIIKLCTSPKRI